MRNKLVFTIASMLILVIILFGVPLIFAQAAWHSVKISAYGYNLIENNLGGASLEFTVAAPPSGLEVNNTISAVNTESGENYSVNIMPGDNIIVTYTGNLVVDHISIADGPESGHSIIEYEGEAGWLQINGTTIPEFPPILIAPLFMTATLLALVYRRKRTI